MIHTNFPQTLHGSPPGRTTAVMVFPPARHDPLVLSPSSFRPVKSMSWRRCDCHRRYCHRRYWHHRFPVFGPNTQKPAKANLALRVLGPGAFPPLTLSLCHKRKNKSRTILRKAEKSFGQTFNFSEILYFSILWAQCPIPPHPSFAGSMPVSSARAASPGATVC